MYQTTNNHCNSLTYQRASQNIANTTITTTTAIKNFQTTLNRMCVNYCVLFSSFILSIFYCLYVIFSFMMCNMFMLSCVGLFFLWFVFVQKSTFHIPSETAPTLCLPQDMHIFQRVVCLVTLLFCFFCLLHVFKDKKN